MLEMESKICFGNECRLVVKHSSQTIKQTLLDDLLNQRIIQKVFAEYLKRWRSIDFFALRDFIKNNIQVKYDHDCNICNIKFFFLANEAFYVCWKLQFTCCEMRVLFSENLIPSATVIYSVCQSKVINLDLFKIDWQYQQYYYAAYGV